MRKFNIGDAVVTTTVRHTYIGVVYYIRWEEFDEEWVYHVLWNDGDKTEENCEDYLTCAKEWRSNV